MDFCISTSELQRIVKLMSVVAKANTSDPSGRILIEAEKDSLKFICNNFSTSLVYTAKEATVNVPGQTSILYSKIRSFISAFKPWNEEFGAKEFCFIDEDDGLYIKVENTLEGGKKSEGKLKVDTFETQFIKKPKEFDKADFALNSSIFRNAVNKVIYAIDPTSFHRHALQGMSLKFDDKNISFAGSNGKVLSEYQVKNISDLKDASFILSYDFIMGLRRIITEETQLFWEISDRDINVKLDNLVFSGKPLTGYEYPNYQPMLKKYEKTLIISKDALMDNIVPFMDILNAEDYYRLTFSVKDGIVTIRNDNAEFVSEQNLNKEIDFVIDLNGLLMKETIDHIQDDKILLKFSDENSVIIFDSENFKDQKALITPIRRR